jgi:hypothetical protein
MDGYALAQRDVLVLITATGQDRGDTVIPNALSVSDMLLVRYSEIQRLKRAEAILASIWSYAHALRDEHWKECECD